MADARRKYNAPTTQAADAKSQVLGDDLESTDRGRGANAKIANITP
jgi:hypothetical protein